MLLQKIAVFICLLFIGTLFADEPRVTVEIDVSEVPELKRWAEDAKAMIIEWHPRMTNLLPSKGFEPSREIKLKIQSSYKGVAATAGSTITVSSHWLDEHPDDVGVIIHELTHVIQAYPNSDPHWITEGIADYVRWVIYEGKPQSWFQRPQEKHGYTQGYRDAAGFLLWLETDKAPGIVNQLNTAMRRENYDEEIFQKRTGQTLDQLWDAYRNEK